MAWIDTSWATATLLIWVRLSALLVFSPIAQALKAPPVVWVLVTLGLSGTLAAGLPAPVAAPKSAAHLALMLLSEGTLGVFMGLALHAAFASLAMAGRLLDLQMGFGMATLLDPVTRANVPIVGVALTLLGVSAFFGSDSHHALIRAAAHLVELCPPGAAWQLPSPGALARTMATLYGMAVVVAAPVLFMLLLVELALDFASRVLPQMNVLFVGAPIKLLVGLTMLAVAAPTLAPTMRRLFAGMFTVWQDVLP